MAYKKLGPDAGGTGTPEASTDYTERSLTQNASELPVLSVEDLTASQLVWLLSDLNSVGNEYRQAEARETLSRYGLDEKSALKLLRKKRKWRRYD